MKKISIPLPHDPYDIYIGDGSIGVLRKLIENKKLNNNILIVTDKNVERLYWESISKLFVDHTGLFNIYSFEPGEASKNENTLFDIFRFMISKGYGRDSLIIAFGGGVTGDIAGFAAASFMRGVQFIQVPTTLLAAVDSSVGGKTGIDFYNVKNVVGAFYQPKFVVIDTAFLSSLPNEEVMCGLGEIMKYAMITGGDFYRYVGRNMLRILEKDEKVLSHLISVSVSIKSEVVLKDEKETGLRKILNLGHTFAHAFESVMNYELKHGQAVIIGLSCASELSYRLGLLDKLTLEEYRKFINSAGVDISMYSLNKEELYQAMLRDKKNRNGKVRFVLPSGCGQTLLDIETEKSTVLKVLSLFAE